MAMYSYYDGRAQVPHLYYYPTSSDMAPVTFLDPRRPEIYRRDDQYVDRDHQIRYRLHDNSGYSRQGLMPMEQVFRSDQGGADHVVTVPYLLDRDYVPNYGGYVGTYHLPPPPWQYYDTVTEDDSSHSMVVEMYVPLCCDECERKVRKHLKDIEGVESVSADQWEKKVVVEGHDLHPQFLLRRMQRDKPASVFWSDRPH